MDLTHNLARIICDFIGVQSIKYLYVVKHVYGSYQHYVDPVAFCTSRAEAVNVVERMNGTFDKTMVPDYYAERGSHGYPLIYNYFFICKIKVNNYSKQHRLTDGFMTNNDTDSEHENDD